jgi:hypothetical protein
VVLGSFIFRDYGIPWDEEALMMNGKMSYDYLFRGDPSLFNYPDRDYGVALELPLYIIQNLFSDPLNIFYFRHACIHVLFLVGLWALYKSLLILLSTHPRKYEWALLAVLMMVLSPRIYADSFYNGKDLVLLSITCIHFYTLLRLLKKPNYTNICIHAFVTAFLIDVRIIGIIHLTITLCWFVYLIVVEKGQGLRWLKMSAVYILMTALILYALWPYLYTDPLNRFIEIFKSMGDFRWKFEVLFCGAKVPSDHLPWYYSFVWIGATTPVIYLIFSLAGVFKILLDFFRKGLGDRNLLLWMSALVFMLAPILAVIILRSVIYDGWRHLYFIYPFLIVVSIPAFISTFNRLNKIKWIGGILILCLPMLNTLYFMVKNHPNQQVYFNEMMPKNSGYLLTHFERDYWGLSYKKAFEIMPQVIPAGYEDTLQVVVENLPGMFNSQFVDPNYKIHVYELQTLSDSMKKTMDYLVTNHRRNLKHTLKKCSRKIWSLDIQQSEVVGIYRLDGQMDCLDY